MRHAYITSRSLALLALLAASTAVAQSGPVLSNETAAAEPASQTPATQPGEAAEAKPTSELNAQQPTATSEAPKHDAKEEAEVESRWSLGARGFGGGLFSKEERSAGGGASLLLAFGIVPERWEAELGLSIAKGRRQAPLGVFEVVGKRVFERRGNWAPHLLLGPLFSLDFGDEVKPAGGLILGTGVTYWVLPRIGIVADASYRLLIGAEVEHIVAMAAGCTFRL